MTLSVHEPEEEIRLTKLNGGDVPGPKPGSARLPSLAGQTNGHDQWMQDDPLPYRFIPLTKGQFAIVDVCDFEELNKFLWHAQWDSRGRKYYAARGIKRPGTKRFRMVKMHNVISQPRRGKMVDHWNGDTLDNRRCNLREATQRQNRMNAATRGSTKSKSGHPGVYWNERMQKWQVLITKNYKTLNLRLHASLDDAIAVRDAAEKRLFGEFASSCRPPALILERPQAATRPPRKSNTSGESNINWCKGYDKWEVTFYRKGERIRVGYFPTIPEAVAARDQFLREGKARENG